ncbi:hypothetical protein HN51_041087 [Arachis hypogaea]
MSSALTQCLDLSLHLTDRPASLSSSRRFVSSMSSTVFLAVRSSSMHLPKKDRYAASLKFNINAVGRILEGLILESTPINTNFLHVHHAFTVRTSKPLS